MFTDVKTELEVVKYGLNKLLSDKSDRDKISFMKECFNYVIVDRYNSIKLPKFAVKHRIQ